MLHSERPDNFLSVVFFDTSAQLDRAWMTAFLKRHIDILERPGTRHITIMERELPHLVFGMLEDDEWEEDKAKFASTALTPIEITTSDAASFVVEDAGRLKEFTVTYTVVHETPEGTEHASFGSYCLSLLLTNTYVTPGVFTYAHVQYRGSKDVDMNRV